MACRPTTQVEAALATAVLGPPRRGLVAYPVCPPTSPMRVHQLGLSQSLWENWGIGFAEKNAPVQCAFQPLSPQILEKIVATPLRFLLGAGMGLSVGFSENMSPCASFCSRRRMAATG